MHSHKQIRSTRKDGNCFYRAFGFRLAELIINTRGEWSVWVVLFVKEFSLKLLTDVGYELAAIEDFHEMFVEVMLLTSLEKLVGKKVNQKKTFKRNIYQTRLFVTCV